MQSLETAEVEENAPMNLIFPKIAGNCTFVSSEMVIPFQELQERTGQRFLLITYTEKTALYTLDPKDPHTHNLKQLGYVFGDRLADAYHPILFRRK